MGKMMLSQSVFCFQGSKITLKNLKISWKIFSLKAFVPFYSWAKLSKITSKTKKNLALEFWKKIIYKFPTIHHPLPPTFFFLFFETFP